MKKIAATKTTAALYREIRAAMVAQGRRSAQGGGCHYRIRDGNETLRCAVGCLVPARHYREAMEGGSAKMLVVRDGKWFADGGDSRICTNRVSNRALAGALNRSKVVATADNAELLAAAQWFHDVKWRPHLDPWPTSAKALLAAYRQYCRP